MICLIEEWDGGQERQIRGLWRMTQNSLVCLCNAFIEWFGWVGTIGLTNFLHGLVDHPIFSANQVPVALVRRQKWKLKWGNSRDTLIDVMD